MPDKDIEINFANILLILILSAIISIIIELFMDFTIKFLFEFDSIRRDIFKKKLLLFFPYYIMRYENEFNELESDGEKRKDLINEYREIVGKLDDSLEDSQFTDLVGLMMKIADYAIPKGIIRREVREVMGGKVLTLNTEKWFSKGHAKGRTEERIENIAKLLSRGGTEDQAKLFLDATDEEIELARKNIVNA